MKILPPLYFVIPVFLFILSSCEEKTRLADNSEEYLVLIENPKSKIIHSLKEFDLECNNPESVFHLLDQNALKQFRYGLVFSDYGLEGGRTDMLSNLEEEEVIKIMNKFGFSSIFLETSNDKRCGGSVARCGPAGNNFCANGYCDPNKNIFMEGANFAIISPKDDTTFIDAVPGMPITLHDGMNSETFTVTIKKIDTIDCHGLLQANIVTSTSIEDLPTVQADTMNMVQVKDNHIFNLGNFKILYRCKAIRRNSVNLSGRCCVTCDKTTVCGYCVELNCGSCGCL